MAMIKNDRMEVMILIIRRPGKLRPTECRAARDP